MAAVNHILLGLLALALAHSSFTDGRRTQEISNEVDTGTNHDSPKWHKLEKSYPQLLNKGKRYTVWSNKVQKGLSKKLGKKAAKLVQSKHAQDDLHLQKLDYGFAHANAGDRKDQTRRPNTIPKDMKKLLKKKLQKPSRKMNKVYKKLVKKNKKRKNRTKARKLQKP